MEQVTAYLDTVNKCENCDDGEADDDAEDEPNVDHLQVGRLRDRGADLAEAYFLNTGMLSPAKTS